MQKNRAAQSFFLLFLGLIVVVTAIPPALAALGVDFNSPIQGGAGGHVAGWTLGQIQLRADLTVLGFAALIAVLGFLYDKAIATRFARLLALTVVLCGVIDGLQFVCGVVLPEGSVTFFDGTLTAVVLGRLGGALVLAVGCAVLRWGHRTSPRAGVIQVALPSAAVMGAAWWAMGAYTSPARLPLLDLNLATLLAYGLAAGFLRAELRHHRLRFFGRGVLAMFIPLAASQLLLAFATHTVVDDAYQVANLLHWFAWLIPAAGLGIDYVNSFYARDVSLEMRFLRAVIDTVPHFIYARDSRGRYTIVNRATAEFHNLKVHEIEGRHVMDIHPDVQQAREWLAEDKETLRSGEGWIARGLPATTPDGETMWIDTIKTPLRTPLGMNDQVLGISIDVTEQRRADAALAAALEAAKESSKAKTEFLANMSHEIRTPMNCIIGLTDLMMDMGGDARQHQYLDMIRMSGATLLTLINDILDISKIEAGQLELDLVETDIHAFIEETAGLIAFTAQAKGLEMVCRLAPGLPERLRVDPGRLRQVLTNLLNNATKFTQQGYVYLDLEVVGERKDAVDLRFRVVDTGIGIAPENLQRIFEKFTQAEAGTTRRFGGTGLGLSISQHLVRLMGGEIAATSEVGTGTTFTFTIPARIGAAAADVVGTAPAAAALRVLVVSSHERGGEVLVEQIRTFGHEARLVADAGEVGPALADSRPWDLVLADEIHFGFEHTLLREALARLPQTARPRVLMLNALTHLPDGAELARVGCDGSLSRPVRRADLAAVLRGETPAGAPTPRTPAAPTANAEPTDLEADPAEGARVLLAEDNPFNQKVATAMLRRLGYRVEVAGNGAEAVDMVRTGGFDLVLMDCQMPVMDGYEATRCIRDLPAPLGSITIIAMTANVLSGDRQACFAAGMNDFLPKPITRDVLQQALDRWDIPATKKPAPREPVVPQQV